MNLLLLLINQIKNPKVVATIKIIIIIVLLFVSLVNGDVDQVLQMVTQLTLGF